MTMTLDYDTEDDFEDRDLTEEEMDAIEDVETWEAFDLSEFGFKDDPLLTASSLTDESDPFGWNISDMFDWDSLDYETSYDD